jgi:WD40 repeat protein
MQRICFLGLVLGGWLPFTAGSWADVVTQPLRKFGLGDLLQVAISPDGQWMATSGSGGAFIWNFTNGAVVHRLEAHHARVQALCFSPDSQVLLTGGLDRTIRAWDVMAGTELRSFTGHLGEISDISFAPDGQSFVSAGDDTARVWSLATGAVLHSLAVTNGGVIRARFTPEGSRLVTADLGFPSTSNVRLWDLASQQMIRSFDHRSIAVGFAASDRLVTAGEDAVVRVWDLETGQLIRPLAGASTPIMGLVASTNSPGVLVGCNNGHVITWDATTGEVQSQFFHEKLVSLAGIPGTNQILAGHAEALVRVKNRDTGDNLRVFAGHSTSTTSGVAFSPDGQYVASGGTEALTRLWNRTNALPLGCSPDTVRARRRCGIPPTARGCSPPLARPFFPRDCGTCRRPWWTANSSGTPVGCWTPGFLPMGSGLSRARRMERRVCGMRRRARTFARSAARARGFARWRLCQWAVPRQRRLGRHRTALERDEWTTAAQF